MARKDRERDIDQTTWTRPGFVLAGLVVVLALACGLYLAFGGRGQPDAPPLITLKSNAVVRNLTIHYPEQTLPEVVPYPWTIRGDGELCQVLDVTMTNPYQALDFGTCWNELHVIRNVFACPLKTGVYIDQCTDIGRIENVHFNPNFWTRMKLKPGFPKADIKAYLEKNLVGFKIGKTDWEYECRWPILRARRHR